MILLLFFLYLPLFTPCRVFSHPLFANCSHHQAESLLKERDVGSVIFRPSSKGPQHISISWAFQEGRIKHIDVLELNKSANDLGLATQLQIKLTKDSSEIFHDLDHIYAEYITPMNEFTKLITSHASFYKGTVESAQEVSILFLFFFLLFLLIFFLLFVLPIHFLLLPPHYHSLLQILH